MESKAENLYVTACDEKNIKLSVIVPIYNVQKNIERCARSLMEQTMKDGIEFISVNDCTFDISMTIIKK